MLFVSQFQQNSRTQIVQFFTIVFRRLKDIHHQHFNLLSHGARKVRKRSLDDTATIIHPIGNILQRLKQYRSNFGQIRYLLINYSLGVVDDTQLSKQSKFIDEKGFILLRHFLPLAQRSLKTDILQIIKDKMVTLPINCEFCQHSIEFTRLLLSVIEQQPAKSILIQILQSQLKRKVNLGQYYIQLKNVSRSQIQTAQILCESFLNLLTIKHYKFTLTQFYQILLIMTNQTKQQEQPKDYWLLISLITRNISSTIKYNVFQHSTITLETNPLDLIAKVKSTDSQILNGTHFQLQIYSIGEQQVNFLFDIVLPKVIAGVNINNLLQDIKRTIYIFEIYLYQSIRAIQDNIQKRGEYIAHLVETVIALLSVALIRREEETDKSFIRMVLFFTSCFLLKQKQWKQVYIIWNFIISFIRQFSKRANATSYNELREALIKQSIQPLFLQFFEIFFRVNNQEYLISFQTIMGTMSSQQTVNLIKEKIIPILEIKQFQIIFEACKKSSFDKLFRKYQQSMLSQQSKLDMEVRTQKKQTLFQAVQKIFEQQSIGQQQARLKYLHQHENYLRQYHSSWNQLWNRLRIYYQPYGIFKAQKNSVNNFMIQSDRIKNYRFKISQYSTVSGIQPILQAQILEPWHVRKTIQQQNKNQLNNLVELMRPNQAKPKKNVGVMSSVTSFLRRIGGDKQHKTYTQYEVLWIKQGRKARGKLTINDRNQIVFWYQSLKQADSHLAFQKFSLLFNEEMVKSWRVDQVRKVIEKRYLMRYSALQLVLLSRKSLLFSFEDNLHQQFLQQLQRIRSNKLQQMGPKLKLNKVPFYMDDWYQQGLPAKITQDWRNRKISTLQYLLAVNKAASRGIYDISQYPVLPWVCQMNLEKQPTLRDLTKTMGGLGSEQRKRIATQKYAAADPFNPVPPFHFGTHYSSPGVVFNFLIRLAPFTDYCKNLQGGKFDIPDRLFASLIQAWRSAYNQLSDVRELVPQFYYIPECLINIEKLHFGDTQSGETVDHVELPPWAANNPYFFTTQMRQMLQSQQCSSLINQWIDLLFGIKQRGQAAKQNFNIYYYLTYQDYSNCLSETEDEVYRKSCEAQIMHFGQIPPQIFQKEHPKRIPRVTQPVELHVSQKIQLMNNIKEKLIGALRCGNELTLIKRNAIETLSLSKSPAVLTRNFQFNFQRTISKSFYAIKREQAKIIFFRHYFLIYGYTTNEFRIFNKNNGSLQFHQSISYKIEHAIVSQDQSLILFGCRSGVLYLFQIEYDTKLFAKQIHVETFMHPISHISQNDGFFTVSFGCYVSIYKFERSLYYLSKDVARPFVKLFRSFHNTLPVKGAFIADIPLYCLILFDKANVKIYSINGQLIKILSCNPKRMYALKDKQLNSLFCVIEEGRLLLLSTPDLRCISELEVGGSLQILNDMVIYEKAIHFIGC